MIDLATSIEARIASAERAAAELAARVRAEFAEQLTEFESDEQWPGLIAAARRADISEADVLRGVRLVNKLRCAAAEAANNASLNADRRTLEARHAAIELDKKAAIDAHNRLLESSHAAVLRACAAEQRSMESTGLVEQARLNEGWLFEHGDAWLGLAYLRSRADARKASELEAATNELRVLLVEAAKAEHVFSAIREAVIDRAKDGHNGIANLKLLDGASRTATKIDQEIAAHFAHDLCIAGFGPSKVADILGSHLVADIIEHGQLGAVAPHISAAVMIRREENRAARIAVLRRVVAPPVSSVPAATATERGARRKPTQQKGGRHNGATPRIA